MPLVSPQLSSELLRQQPLTDVHQSGDELATATTQIDAAAVPPPDAEANFDENSLDPFAEAVDGDAGDDEDEDIFLSQTDKEKTDEAAAEAAAIR